MRIRICQKEKCGRFVPVPGSSAGRLRQPPPAASRGTKGSNVRSVPPSVLYAGAESYRHKGVKMVGWAESGDALPQSAEVTVDGVRYEVPARFRQLPRLLVRYPGWDKSQLALVDPQSGSFSVRLNRSATPLVWGPSTKAKLGLMPQNRNWFPNWSERYWLP